MVDLDDMMCNDETKEAIEFIKKDTLQLVLINDFPRYEKELSELLSQANIQLLLIASMHGEGTCLRAVMDSVINERFGSDFRMKIKDKADSLFFVSNKESIFPEQQLDKRPTLASNPDSNGQDEIIKRLNKKYLQLDSIQLRSNIVNAPYFVVRFTVAKDGTSSNAEIVERNSTHNFINLEKIIIDEINSLNEWKAGQIRNESVSSIMDVAIAVNEKPHASNSNE